MKLQRERLTKIFESKNLLRVVIGLPIGIFLSEVIAMAIVYFIEVPYILTILIDAIVTTSMMLPIIYLLSYRPLLINIAERERAEKIMQFRLRLIQFSESHELEELLIETLDDIESLIGGTIGFFHFLEADQKTLWLQAWSTNTIQNMCNAEGKDSHYDLNEAGVWADCVRLRQPIVHNDYAHLDNRKGIPAGHAPIIRELTVPISRNGLVVAIFGIGNKPKKFTKDDVDLVSTLADFAWDIIERKRAEIILRDSEEKFRTLADWTYDWELWVDSGGHFVYISPSCEQASGYRPEEFILDPSLSTRIVHPDDRKLYEQHKQLIHDENAGASNLEYRIIARDGSEHWIDHICRPLFGKDNQYLGRRVSNRDITIRKLAEKEISERTQKEYMLTNTIQTIQLDIARDLHDTVGQNVSYLRMRLDHLKETNLQTQLDLKTEIANMLNVANESYNLLRGTMDMLQSGGVDDLGNLMTQYATQVEKRRQFKILLSNLGESRHLSTNEVRQLFFVYREALNNIEKYADASKVLVELDWADEYLIMTISDDGNGFNLEDEPIRNHYGLKFMQERIKSINGVFSIQSFIGKGTSIKITLPLKKQQPV